MKEGGVAFLKRSTKTKTGKARVVVEVVVVGGGTMMIHAHFFFFYILFFTHFFLSCLAIFLDL